MTLQRVRLVLAKRARFAGMQARLGSSTATELTGDKRRIRQTTAHVRRLIKADFTLVTIRLECVTITVPAVNGV